MYHNHVLQEAKNDFITLDKTRGIITNTLFLSIEKATVSTSYPASYLNEFITIYHDKLLFTFC
jgi:hypothetical protein